MRHTNLLTDLYQLNMVEAYLDHAMTDAAVFEFFIRDLPKRRGFLVAAGLQQVLEFLQNLEFSKEELDALSAMGRFTARLTDYLGQLHFSGDVHALPEGTVFFANEPILRITAPLPEAQLIETRLTNILHYQTLVASKAARIVLAAPGKQLVDFGLRRAHGAEAGLFGARASYLAGFSGTATVLAGEMFGIPLFGTMAHSFVQAFDDETEAFAAFATSRPKGVVLLLDTYDTVAAAQKAIALAPRLQAKGIAIAGVRLDSGDLIVLSKQVRSILDAGGLNQTRIFASGGLDEDQLAAITAVNAPIDGFGIGTSLVTSTDAAALDCAYKLQEYAGRPRRKLSPGKSTLPGRKQIWRAFDNHGRMLRDVLSTADDAQQGTPLLEPVMQGGKLVRRQPSLQQARSYAAEQLAKLPPHLYALATEPGYEISVTGKLLNLADQAGAGANSRVSGDGGQHRN